jgi:hypothetical protein
MIVALLLFGIFVFALQHLRMVKHAGVFFGVQGTVAEVEAAHSVRWMLSSASWYFWFCQRASYMLIPALAFFFGPTFCLVASGITAGFMAAVDIFQLPKMQPRRVLHKLRHSMSTPNALRSILSRAPEFPPSPWEGSLTQRGKCAAGGRAVWVGAVSTWSERRPAEVLNRY